MNALEYPTSRWARELPDHPAVIAGGLVVTYADLETQISAVASRLAERSVTAGDRVVVCAANSVAWIVTAHAIARLGAVLVPVSTRILASDSALLTEKYRFKFVLSDTGAARLWTNAKPIEAIAGSSAALSNVSLPEEFDPDALHSIVSTSGTEGEPKGVCLSFRNHLANALGSAFNLGVQPHDRWLLNLPLYHVGGLAIVLRAAIYGTTVVLHEHFDAVLTWESMERDHVTQMSLVATTLRRLLDAKPEHHCPKTVRAILVGGGPVPTSLIDEARGRGFPILPTYGMTETASQIATLAPSAPQSKRHTAGMPLALAEITIRDESGEPLPAGQEGRIWVRGPMVASGYWENAKSIRRIVDDAGWFATKDIGSLDADGYLLVHGRLDNVIISGGEKIHAEEIENALSECDAVSRSVVIGAEDAEWGQRPVAYVELRPGTTVDHNYLMASLVGKLPRHKLPVRIDVVPELPTMSTGKLDRKRIRQPLKK